MMGVPELSLYDFSGTGSLLVSTFPCLLFIVSSACLCSLSSEYYFSALVSCFPSSHHLPPSILPFVLCHPSSAYPLLLFLCHQKYQLTPSLLFRLHYSIVSSTTNSASYTSTPTYLPTLPLHKRSPHNGSPGNCTVLIRRHHYNHHNRKRRLLLCRDDDHP